LSRGPWSAPRTIKKAKNGEKWRKKNGKQRDSNPGPTAPLLVALMIQLPRSLTKNQGLFTQRSAKLISSIVYHDSISLFGDF
jgi:hypothetical protein